MGYMKTALGGSTAISNNTPQCGGQMKTTDGAKVLYFTNILTKSIRGLTL